MKKSFTRLLIFLTLLIIILSGSMWAQDKGASSDAGAYPDEGKRYYISNEFGLAIEEIGWYRQDEYSYVLKVERAAQKEIKMLLAAGEEIKRWELAPGEERVYEEGQISLVRLFDAAGRIKEERSFEQDEEVLKTLFHYSSSGICFAETFAGDGNLLYTDSYRLSGQGQLREVSRVWADGQTEGQSLSITNLSGVLYEEQHSAAESNLIYRFDSEGKLFSRERWREGILAMREQLDYSDGSKTPLSAVEINYIEGEKIQKTFDEEGRLTRRIVEREGRIVEELSHYWDDAGNKTQTVRSSAKGLERWNFSYDPAGELTTEDYRVRGSLEKVTNYNQEGRVEELFRNGKLFLRVTYRNDEKIEEEFLKDGSVVRVRVP